MTARESFKKQKYGRFKQEDNWFETIQITTRYLSSLSYNMVKKLINSKAKNKRYTPVERLCVHRAISIVSFD